MATSHLVLVNGIPGTGKTTLAAKLSRDLDLPLIGKDMIKEMLFDQMGAREGDWSKTLGRVSSKMLNTAIDTFLVQNVSIIAESAFIAEFESSSLSHIVKAHGIQCLEIYCTTEVAENERRFRERVADGSRHPVHTDGILHIDDAVRKRYEPLAIQKVISVDTTHLDDAAYMALLQNIREELRHA